MRPQDTLPGPFEGEAIAWLMRVQSEAATAEDWTALAAWLEQSDAHADAFDRVEAISAEIADGAADIAAAINRRTEPVVVGLTPRKPRAVTWAPLAGLAAAAIIVVAAPLLRGAYDGAPIAYQTAVGETRNIALGEGSHVQLDGGSAMTARMGWLVRRVDLGRGQASFDVAHFPGRPFVVNVADQQVRDVGTQFNIRHDRGTVVISVRSGAVDVIQPGLGSDPVARLLLGDELTHVEGARVSTQQRVDPQAAFAWRTSRLICNDQSLSEIVAQLNRRYATPIRVSPAAGAKRFSGVLALSDQAVLVKTLADYLSLTVRRTEREIVLN
jgi:transmembrane sensor